MTMHISTKTDKVGVNACLAACDVMPLNRFLKGLKGPIFRHFNRHYVCHGVNNIFVGAFFYSYQDDFTLRQVGAYMTESYVLNVGKITIWVIPLQTYNP